MRSPSRLRLRLPPAVAVALALAAGALASCGGAAVPGAATAGDPSTTGGEPPLAVAGAGSPAAAAAVPPCRASAPAPAASDPRARGIDALMEGRPREATSLLGEAVRARPSDAAAEVFRGASMARRSAENERATAQVSDAPVVALPAIPLARAPGSAPISGPKVRLTRESERKNLITDHDDWLKNNGLTLRDERGAENLPEHVGKSYRKAPLGELFRNGDHDIGVYGTFLVVTAPGKEARVYDAAAAMQSGPQHFQVEFAQLVGGVLVVQLAYNGYANSTGGKNGYIAAFDAAAGRLLWSSDPLVANRSNFHVAGGSLIAGYGFTAEPDFLFVLDLATGAVDQKIPIKSGPDWILARGDQIFVRTYDTDYVFRPAGPLPPAPPAALDAASAAARDPLIPEARCWAHAAAAAIDRRDARALGEATAALAQLTGDRVLEGALGRARAALEARGHIDLSTAQPVVLPRPPWAYALLASPPAPAPAGKPPTLVKVAGGEPAPARPLDKPPFRADRPFFLAPIERGKLPPGARRDIPSSYGLEDLRAIIPSDDRTLLVYGGRYLVSLRGDTTERIFDVDAFRHAPDPDPQTKEFAVQDLTYAQVKDGTLYLCNGGGSYARDVKGKKGFVSALDFATGRLLWRSEPLVCNATFVLTGDYMVTGYGFTDEPDHVFLVRRADGKVVQKVRVDTGPTEITAQGDRILVEAHADRYLFELRKP